MSLSDRGIKEALRTDDLEIVGFDEHFLQPSCYDVRVGDQAWVSGSSEPVHLAAEGELILRPFQWAILVTHEKLKLSAKIKGQIHPRGTWSRRGLSLYYGGQVDPGWEGPLILTILNTSSRPLRVPSRAAICGISFSYLTSEAERPYQPTDDQKAGRIPPDVIRYIQTQTVRAISDIDDAVRSLEATAENLRMDFDGLIEEITQQIQTQIEQALQALRQDVVREMQRVSATSNKWIIAGFGALIALFGGVIYFMFQLAMEVGRIAGILAGQ